MENVFLKLQKKIVNSERKLNNRISKCSLFSKSRTNPITQVVPPSEPHSDIESLTMVERPPPNVRLLLFKEFVDTCDRPIVFDSKSLEKIEETTQCNNLPQNLQCNEAKPQYKFVRTPPDWKMLSEMLFGSVGIAQKAPSLKIHHIKSPPQIMLSRVFCLPSSKDQATVSLDQGLENHLEMLRSNAVSSRRKASTMPVPLPHPIPPPMQQFPRSESSSSLSNFLSSSYQGLRNSGTGSLGSSRNRIPVNQMKSHSLPKNQRDSFTLHGEINDGNIQLRRSRLRIGFAVLCEPEPSNETAFSHFFFEHFPIIETHITKLKNDIEEAFKCRGKQEFYRAMMQALSTFATRLQTLYSTPRLLEPVWSTINSPVSSQQRSVVVNCFISDLVRLHYHCNNKQNNFFLTSLLTAVLSHHLGWVTSAAPPAEQKGEIENYNPLWAQLGDMYGAVGSPTKVCRTVVTGANHEWVSTVLSVLTYFIRSSRIDDVIPVPDDITPSSLRVQSTVPMKQISTNLVDCELEDDQYVLVSVTDHNHPPPHRPNLAKSKSTPNAAVEGESPLSRSYSGPLKRGDAVSELRASTRQRTHSNEGLSRQNTIRSRRRSHDMRISPPSDGVLATNNSTVSNQSCVQNQSCISNHSSVTNQSSMQNQSCVSNQSTINSSPKSGIPPNQSSDVKAFELKLPVIPTHRPGCDLTLTTPQSGDSPCKEIGLHVLRLEPPVQTVLNVQRSCASVVKKAPPKLPTFAPNTKPAALIAQKESNEPRGAVRSASNPSLRARDTLQPNIRRITSNCGAKTRIGARRHKLPSSPGAAPSIEHIKLMRIPSIEINHNVFDEYFNESDDDDVTTPSTPPSIYPSLPQGNPPTPPPHGKEGEVIPKLYPPLPATGPVGELSFQPGESPSRPTQLELSTPPIIEDETPLHPLPMPDIAEVPTEGGRKAGFQSLMADYNGEYLNDFVLHGSCDHPDTHQRILDDLDHMTKIPPLDEPVAEAVCVLANTEDWTVGVYSSHRLRSNRPPSIPALTSKLVGAILQRIAQMYNHKMSAQFCMDHLERELRQLVLKSRMLAEYVRGFRRVPVDQLSAVLDIESKDLPLLMAVASCRSPHVAPLML